MNLRSDQIRKYFESRMPEAKFRKPGENMIRCPFHQDGTASLSVNLEKGTFNCFGCNVKGGYLAFEMKFSSCDEATAWANIAEIVGEKQAYIPGQKPEATYQYFDAVGKLAFEKLRYPGKRFSQRRPDGKGGWIYKLDAITRKPLYNFPSVLVANEILIAEGEKDADNAAAALKSVAGAQGVFIAGTTNFDGAGKWKDSESVFFAGKRVVILADNDEVGRKHAETVARSVYPYAFGVRVVHFPELPEHGDVSDFLKSHQPHELVERIKKAKQWRPAETDPGLLVPVAQFVSTVHERIDWIVEGVIHEGANGVFAADPKAGKSWAAADLAVSVATGARWLDFPVVKPIRTALVAREDAPGLTAWRLGHLLRGKTDGDISLIEKNLWVNTRQQSPDYKLDIDELHQEMIQELKERAIKLVILDVFNVLHSADENDNQEMRAILQRLTDIQSQAGCQIALIHHFNKADTGSLVKRMRGSSAISGWVEWAVGISIADPDLGIRRMEFETKAAQPPEPINFRIISENGSDSARLQRVQYTAAAKPSREGNAASRLIS